MKGVIIKDLELPKACAWYDDNDNYRECPFMKYDGYCCVSDNVDCFINNKPKECPLRYIEISID